MPPTPYTFGLANRVAADVAAATAELLAELLACAPLAVGLAKRLIDASARPALSTTLELEITAQELCARSEDVSEGVRAAAERRAPHFKGRYELTEGLYGATSDLALRSVAQRALALAPAANSCAFAKYAAPPRTTTGLLRPLTATEHGPLPTSVSVPSQRSVVAKVAFFAVVFVAPPIAR